MRVIVLSSILLLATAGALLGATFAQRTDASGGGPEMALRVEGEGMVCEPGGDIDTCTVPLSGEFTLTVDLLEAPEQGYVAVQAFVDYGQELDHTPRLVIGDEVVWPDCEPGPRLTKVFSAGRVAIGCLTGLLPPLPASHYVGPMFEFDFACSAEDSVSTVALLPFGEAPAGPDGAQLVLSDGITGITPKVDSIRVVCGEEPAPKPEMALRVEGDGVVCEPGEDIDTCTIPLSGEFALTVDLLHAPGEGYGAFQTLVYFGEDLGYLPRATIADEFLFPDCAPSVKLGGLFAMSVAHGCITAKLPPLPASHYSGAMVQMDLVCSEGDSSTTVHLQPLAMDGVNGTALFPPDAMIVIEPKLDSVEIVCAGEPAPEPTSTPTPTPTSTPAPMATPMLGVLGDADGDGDITSLDAALILQYVASLLGSGDLPNADVNQDGVVDSRDAALVLQYVAGLIEQLAP